MQAHLKERSGQRYSAVTREKAGGATYTPKILADFLATQIVTTAKGLGTAHAVRILDPAVGDGQLIISLLGRLDADTRKRVVTHGFETNPDALRVAEQRIKDFDPDVSVQLGHRSFLDLVLHGFGDDNNYRLFCEPAPEMYDLIIANPPYVRTQVMGANQARLLAKRFALSGRVDLYYAFLLGIASVLKPAGIAGIIVSNRFMTTRAGAAVRREILQQFKIKHVWDLGDTKLFDAAILPSILLAEGTTSREHYPTKFTSIYETTQTAVIKAADPIAALSKDGEVLTDDGRRFLVRHGQLNTSGTLDGVWRIETTAVAKWLETVGAHTWGTFGDVGKIRVGVKTCADKTFIRDDWDNLRAKRPELLRPVTTHHIARRYKATVPDRPKEILYPHEVVQGIRRAIDLSFYPVSKVYLETHRDALSGRKYVLEAGRQWYEIWVPQDPEAWSQPKLVFRDISKRPTFWIDLDGSIVNGDCYWLACESSAREEWLWLAAAVANSTFIEKFYDYRYHNKLYAGRRRFITQYVETFPLPNPEDQTGKALIKTARDIYDCIPSPRAQELDRKLNRLVWEAFGLADEEVDR